MTKEKVRDKVLTYF